MHGPLNAKICMPVKRLQRSPHKQTRHSRAKPGQRQQSDCSYFGNDSKQTGRQHRVLQFCDWCQANDGFLQFHINFIPIIAMTGNPTATASSLLRDAQMGFGVRPASYSTGTRGSSPSHFREWDLKRPGHQADHSPPSTVKWSCTSTLPYSAVAVAGVTLLSILFLPQSVLRQVHSLFQSDFPREGNLLLPLSISSILSSP